jgi:hypothetical protein
MMHAPRTPPAPRTAPPLPNPLAIALSAMPCLSKLRIGHSARVSHLAGLPQHPSGHCAAAVHGVYIALAGLAALQDLTLDCHPSFDSSDLAAAVTNRGLRCLRLMGSSAISQRHLTALTALRCLSRLVIGPSFLLHGEAHQANRSLAGLAFPAPPTRCQSKPLAILPTLKRVFEGLLSASGGSLEVLQVQGVLEEPMRECLRSSLRLKGLLFGSKRCSVWDGACHSAVLVLRDSRVDMSGKCVQALEPVKLVRDSPPLSPPSQSLAHTLW